jgi:hypothetical protein
MHVPKFIFWIVPGYYLLIYQIWVQVLADPNLFGSWIIITNKGTVSTCLEDYWSATKWVYRVPI